mmetsp:Transcript_15739/g.44042  ORF Transcript_15739/g.44042 Transcript_15739/m.44042 type:complete len:297 (+) Transcript_15739:449-1339(+)
MAMSMVKSPFAVLYSSWAGSLKPRSSWQISSCPSDELLLLDMLCFHARRALLNSGPGRADAPGSKPGLSSSSAWKKAQRSDKVMSYSRSMASSRGRRWAILSMLRCPMTARERTMVASSPGFILTGVEALWAETDHTASNSPWGSLLRPAKAPARVHTTWKGWKLSIFSAMCLPKISIALGESTRFTAKALAIVASALGSNLCPWRSTSRSIVSYTSGGQRPFLAAALAMFVSAAGVKLLGAATSCWQSNLFSSGDVSPLNPKAQAMLDSSLSVNSSGRLRTSFSTARNTAATFTT